MIVWSNVSDHFFLRLTCEVVEVVIKLNLVIIIYSLLSCLWLWLPNNNLIIIQTFVRRTLSSIRAESEAPNRTVLMVMIRMVDHFWYQLTVVVMEGGGHKSSVVYKLPTALGRAPGQHICCFDPVNKSHLARHIRILNSVLRVITVCTS